ncbi:MAG TPA: hypothetical protein VES67_08220 [Vicinamibacterales bacterium]|nr:hypothetical protein [Vicinamibacterales bacterium]
MEKTRLADAPAFSPGCASATSTISSGFMCSVDLNQRIFAGDASQGWLILKNCDHVIGLFQGMFEKNILTFNPGWDSNAQKLATFTDIRQLQRQLRAQGVQFQQQADESTTGPASFVAVDPDGNPILVDQHV